MLKSLFFPRAIGVVGASKSEGKVGHAVIKNLVDGGFKGAIVPVNPREKELLGLKCYPGLDKYDGKIELSVIAVPPSAVKGAVLSSINSGAKAVVVITAGFKEVGAEGAKAEREIAQICAEHRTRLLGPNCLGIINTECGLNASFAAQMPKPGNISVISQSGALGTAILDWASGRHLGLAKLVSLGNKADIDEVDLLLSLGEDEQTKVIVGYLESIQSGEKFIKAAHHVATRKPVIILKSGSSQAGSRAASSHTGSLAGADIAYGAAFLSSGVIRAETFDTLLDYATALAMQPLPKGDRIAIITNAGGPGIMAADAVEHQGMRVSVLKTSTASALKAKLPSSASVGNPIDVLGDADPDRYVTALEAAQKDETVDAVLVILTPQAMTHPAETARAIAKCMDKSKPILVTFMGGSEVMPGRQELAASNLPDYDSPERAVAALKAMVNYRSWLSRPPRVVTRFPVNRQRVRRILGRYRRMGQVRVGEMDAKEILAAYDFNVPKGKLVDTVEDAVQVAEQIGYPVVMKIVSPDIVHKSDLGGVKVGLSNADQVSDAFDLMLVRIRRKAPKARIAGVYLEKMAPRGLEVILGMNRDPAFGPMLMFGLGGIFVEVMKDVTFHLAPITSDEAMQMLKATRSYAMLEGARGREGVDLAAIAAGLQRISQLSSDFPEIEEMDINPFIVGTVGRISVVADARISISSGVSEND